MINNRTDAVCVCALVGVADMFRVEDRVAALDCRPKQNKDMRLLTRGILSTKCVVRRFHCCENVIECTYTNLDSIACYTPRLYGMALCS